MIKKNTAGQFIYFGLASTTDGSAVTGVSPTGYVSKDGGAQAGIGGSITERGNGQYEYAPSAGDVNGDECGFFFTAAGAVPVSITVTTETKKMADLNDVAVGAEMKIEDGAISSDTYDETSCWPLKAVDTGSTQLARVGADGDTLETLSDQIDGLPTDADVNAQCDLALSDIHLDHLLAVNYDPASKPGVVTALLNELVENDGGVSRFTANSLEESPAATGDASSANQDTIITHLTEIKGTGFVEDTDSLVDLAHIGADGDTLETLSDQIDAVPDASEINAEVDTAIETYHLDHLLAVDYDPSSPPGIATALLNEVIESDGGVSRFTANALEEAPGAAGDATSANQDTIITHLTEVKGTGFVADTNSLVDLALASVLSTTDGKVDDILTDTGTTLNDKIDIIDGIVDTIEAIFEGDHSVDTTTTPWQYLIKNKTTAATLVQKDLKKTDGSNVTSTTHVVGQKVEP